MARNPAFQAVKLEIQISRAHSVNLLVAVASPEHKALMSLDDFGTLIRVDKVSKSYVVATGQILALDNISLSVGTREFITIVGPSGCGKTTFLRLLAGLTQKSSGELIFRDNNVDSLPKREFGFVFQFPVLLPWNTTFHNILFPVKMAGEPLSKYEGVAHSLIQLTGLSGFERAFPWELSGGMQQRVAICRALVKDPSILLMDEPFGSLDAFTREMMQYELLRIWSQQKKTVILVTHSVDEAVFLSDRVVVMTPRPGRIAKVVDVSLRRPRDSSTRTEPLFVEISAQIREALASYMEQDAHRHAS